MSTSSTRSPQTETLYFAYGSNLSLGQMSRRCPQSRYIGHGILHDYKWAINGRGYATVHPSPGDWVEGLCYLLSPADEENLDVNEGVAMGCYTKETLEVTVRPGHAAVVGRLVGEADVRVMGVETGGRDLCSEGEGSVVECLVYVSPGLEVGRARSEYVGRIGAGVRDAAKLGMGEEYYLRYISPLMGGGVRH
ncbi:BtrG-like protein [Glarea lozoyensis ATCC 20868]|uniref:gamma-glutamylcyclotransferase n=1 Tax=Glarea lozoyensis (strain ATCC 20868 / MF5171) TaxID=1116229 RepID=S3DGD8_GLAL2|nr:BtrG-like protein [Glarea lozoyensis ATCC 20868]EPE31091.1 BtrG-like protein [Glarea lozoyensis ATCC 20868]